MELHLYWLSKSLVSFTFFLCMWLFFVFSKKFNNSIYWKKLFAYFFKFLQLLLYHLLKSFLTYIDHIIFLSTIFKVFDWEFSQSKLQPVNKTIWTQHKHWEKFSKKYCFNLIISFIFYSNLLHSSTWPHIIHEWSFSKQVLRLELLNRDLIGN